MRDVYPRDFSSMGRQRIIFHVEHSILRAANGRNVGLLPTFRVVFTSRSSPFSPQMVGGREVSVYPPGNRRDHYVSFGLVLFFFHVSPKANVNGPAIGVGFQTDPRRDIRVHRRFRRSPTIWFGSLFISHFGDLNHLLIGNLSRVYRGLALRVRSVGPVDL